MKRIGEADEVWQCRGCQAAYNDKSDAFECCEPLRVWACGECDSIYNTEGKAQDCCKPNCVVCEELFVPDTDTNVCEQCRPDPGREADERYEAAVGK